MKKILFALVVVMLMTSCNGQNNGKQQSENADSTKKVFIPNKMLQAPVEKQAPISEFNVVNPDGTRTPIKVEDGKPIDLSQLMGGQKKSFAQQMTDNIDSIRYKAEHGNASYQYLRQRNFSTDKKRRRKVIRGLVGHACGQSRSAFEQIA